MHITAAPYRIRRLESIETLIVYASAVAKVQVILLEESVGDGREMLLAHRYRIFVWGKVHFLLSEAGRLI